MLLQKDQRLGSFVLQLTCTAKRREYILQRGGIGEHLINREAGGSVGAAGGCLAVGTEHCWQAGGFDMDGAKALPTVLHDIVVMWR